MALRRFGPVWPCARRLHRLAAEFFGSPTIMPNLSSPLNESFKGRVSALGRTLQIVTTRKIEPRSPGKRIRRAIQQFAFLARVAWDFIQGMRVLYPVGPCVTVFGSARLCEPADEYRLARLLGAALAGCGLTIMTGGGPGLMEAVSRGARESGGRAVGCRIRVSAEQRANIHLDRAATFRYFFVRKVMMVRNARGFVALPGGLGTLDELFEVLTLMQMKKLAERPIVFLGTAYWRPLLDFIQGMEQCGTIKPNEMALIMRLVLFTDDVNLAVAHIQGHAPSFSGATKPQAVDPGLPTPKLWTDPVPPRSIDAA